MRGEDFARSMDDSIWARAVCTCLSWSLRVPDVVGAIIVCDGSGRSFAISKHADVLHVKHQRHAEQILLTQEKGVKDYNPMVCYAVSSGCLFDV